ncbi:hypothetical protein ACIRPK_35825 [Kitasatospora sp. NPDC101801]|uniref:hypothetical protein n=1 Tax=Kitasatospora sp. NPDC101801 TaxID=3364103 RepID=UPI00382F6C9C
MDRGAVDQSWTCAEQRAWVLTKRALGYDPGDLLALEAGLDTAEAAIDRQHLWLPASRVLALAAWRASRELDVQVDDLPLSRCLWWLGGARFGESFAAPLPPWTPAMPGGWQQLQARIDDLRWIATWHCLAHVQETRKVAGSADGTSTLPLLIGDRVRAVLAGPCRDQTPPRWSAATDFAQEAIASARQALSGR